MLSEAKHFCIVSLLAVAFSACGSAAAQEPFHYCSSQISADKGSPTLIPYEAPLNWGLSAKPAAEGKSLMVFLWLENPTAERQPVMSCTDIDNFWFNGFDVLDNSGHRVSRRGETVNGAGDTQLVECARNILFYLEPYSCQITTAQGTGDFSRDLLTYYDLPAGKYKIVPKKKHEAGGLEIEVTLR